MATITVKTENLRGEIAPLYHRYPQQTNAQGAYVEMTEDGEVSADSDGEIGGAVPFSAFHRRTLRWGVNAYLRGDALADHLESDEVRALLQRIHDGQEIEWDGNNNVGRLDEDAQQAEIDLEAGLQALSEDESAAGAVWPVDEWLQNSALDDLWPVGKTISEAVQSIEKDARLDHVALDGDVARYLLDRAARENEDGKCYRVDVLTALHADGRHPVDEDDDPWTPESAGQKRAAREDRDGWILAHGSERLRKGLESGMIGQMLNVYLDERIANDLGAEWVNWNTAPEPQENKRLNPPEAELDALMAARAKWGEADVSLVSVGGRNAKGTGYRWRPALMLECPWAAGDVAIRYLD